MKKTHKLFNIAMGAVLIGAMASCSDDGVTGGGETTVVPSETVTENALNSTALSVNSPNTSRVSNYMLALDSRRSRAAEFEMPEYPADRAAAAQELENGWFSGSGDYKVDGSKAVQINANGAVNLFIVKDCSLRLDVNNANPLNIYVAPGVTFTFPDNSDNIYSQGYNMYVYGTLNAKNIQLSSNQSIYVAGDLDVQETVSSNGNNTSLYVAGEFSAKSLQPQTGFSLSGCSIILESDFTSYSQDFWINAKYFYAPTIFLGGDRSGINLEDGGMVKTESLTFQGNNGSNQIKGNGVIVAKTITINNFDNNATNFASHFQGTVYNDTATPTSINNHDVVRESQAGAFQPYSDGLSIEVPSCGSVEETPVLPPHIELVTRVVNHDHNSDKPSLRHLSATAITYGNGRYYASYHMRGGNWANDSYDKGSNADTEGCIESWTMNDDVLTLDNWMWTDQIDFNHIYFDNQAESGKKVVTMGHHAKKGGIFGYVSENFADNANIGDDNTLKYDVIKSSVRIENATGVLQDWANGGDVNSAYRASGSSNYLITTSRGYTTVDASTGNQTREASDINKGGIPVLNIFNDSVSVKHITPYNGGFAVLALDERKVATATASSTATVYFFDSEASVVAGTPYTSTQLTKGVVSPVDGKNVLFANGNELYACLGQGGLVRLNGTVEADSWQRPAVENDETSNGNVPVNGVYADNNYVYVANGNNLTILDKSFNEVANYQVPDNEDGRSYSANYVLVNDGLIFVAYGQDGIRVLRLVE